MTSLLNKYGLNQLISQPTRITEHSSTLIDLIITSNKNIVTDLNVLRMDGISDHMMVDCCLNIKKGKQCQILHTYRNFSKFNLDNFLNDLYCIEWSRIYMYDNVEDMIEFWNRSLIYLFNIHAPFKTVRISKPPAPWLSDNLKLMIRLKNKAYSKYKKVQSEAAWN